MRPSPGPGPGGFFELAASIRGTNLGGGDVRLQQRHPDTGHDNTTYTATLVIADQPIRQVFTALRSVVAAVSCSAHTGW